MKILLAFVFLFAVACISVRAQVTGEPSGTRISPPCVWTAAPLAPAIAPMIDPTRPAPLS